MRERRKPGRPAAPSWAVDMAHTLYLEGLSPREIAQDIAQHGHQVSDRRIRAWAAEKGWAHELAAMRKTPEKLRQEIARLAAMEQTPATAQMLAMLTKALDRMQRTTPKPKPRPAVRNHLNRDLLRRALDPSYGLRQYQRDYVISDARFELWLKSRQIGFSYITALKRVLRASAGRKQLIISASQRQANNVLGYVLKHCEKLEVVPDEVKKDRVKIAGTDVFCLPPNFMTVQGFDGDVTFDEFAWIRQQKRMWEAVVPSITAVGGTVEVGSTPFVPGSFFWELCEDPKARWGQFERHRITIHDAIAQGMELPGGIAELQGLFDPDSWAMMYLCQWAEDGTALLSWEALQKAVDPKDYSVLYDGPVWIGVDVARVRHRTWIVVVGRLDDGRYVVLRQLDMVNTPFPEQKARILQLAGLFNTQRVAIDAGGLGRQLAEEVCTALPGVGVMRHFYPGYKERLALGLYQMMEDRRLILENDPAYLASMHAVKRRASATGLRYEADDTDGGHGDAFWGTALAVDGFSKVTDRSLEVEVW